MSTIRVVRRNRFTTIDRETVNDERLSFRARGILLWLLDKPDDWSCNAEAIERAGIEGREAVRSGLRELVEYGYILRFRKQNEKGQWVSWSEVHERPATSEPTYGNPSVGEPGALMKTDNEDCERRESSTLAERPKNPIWDALVEAVGPVATKTESSLRGKCVKELKEAGATPEDIYARAAEYRRRWKVDLTDVALVKHWSLMADVRPVQPAQIKKNPLQDYLNRTPQGELA